MVNEADGFCAAEDGDTAYDAWGVVPGGDVCQGVAIHDTEILHLKGWDAVNLVYHVVVCLLYCEAKGTALIEDAVNVGSRLALFRGEKSVATAHRQSVALADNGAGNNLQLEAEVVSHATDNGNLLVVLLSEIRTVGFHVGEKLAYNLTDTVEVPRTHGTLHDCVGGRIAELACVRFRINLLHTGCKGDVCPTFLEQTAVCLKRTRVALQVFRVVKLGWIEENADHCDIILLYTSADQRGMSFMQGTHCGYETYAVSLTAMLSQTFAELTNSAYYFHVRYKKSCKGTKKLRIKN